MFLRGRQCPLPTSGDLVLACASIANLTRGARHYANVLEVPHSIKERMVDTTKSLLEAPQRARRRF